MFSIRNVCEKCEERTPGCHSSCPAYLEARKELDEKKKRINGSIEAATYIMDNKRKKKR